MEKRMRELLIHPFFSVYFKYFKEEKIMLY